MVISPGLFLIGIGTVSFTSYSLPLGTGLFNITGVDIAIIGSGSMPLGTGIFTIDTGNTSIYGACQPGNIIDKLAAEAPYPPPSFFIPVTDGAPTFVLSPDAYFGAGSLDSGSAVYITYYNSVARTWDDVGYQSQYNTAISPDLKQRVADQTYLYDQYVVDLSRWQDKYNRELLFQWPYYWAQNVARAPGSTPGGTESCCSSGGGGTSIFKRRFVVIAPSATPAVNLDVTDIASIVGLSVNITSMTTNLTGTPENGVTLVMWQITDDGVSRNITWGASFSSTIDSILPTATIAGTLLRVLTQWNAVTSKHECISVNY